MVWLSGWSANLRAKGSLVRFPVRAHAWVADQVPSMGHARGNHTLMFLSLSLSIPSLLSRKSLNKILIKKEMNRKEERVGDRASSGRDQCVCFCHGNHPAMVGRGGPCSIWGLTSKQEAGWSHQVWLTPSLVLSEATAGTAPAP